MNGYFFTTTGTGTTATSNVFVGNFRVTFGSGFAFRAPKPPDDDGLAGCYAVLGVPPNSPPDVLRKAYRERLMETHPDHGGDDESVRRVIAAYERLTRGVAA